MAPVIAAASEADACLCESEETLRLYEKAFEDRASNMVYARTYEQLVPDLAGNARCQAIVARMNFPSLAE